MWAKKNVKPLKLLEKPTFKNGEVDYYKVMKGGVLFQEIALVYSNISPNTTRIYMLMKDKRKHFDWPRDLSHWKKNYYYFDMDRKTGSMVYGTFNMLDMFKGNNLKGPYFMEYKYQGDTMILTLRYWDGTSSRESVQRMEHIDKNIPLLEYNLVGFCLSRFFDINSKGVIQTVSAGVLRDPVKGRLTKKGSTTVKTDMGKFKTDRYINELSGDPFLYNLIKNYVKGFVFYIEKGGARRVIKTEDKLTRRIFYLSDVLTWAEFKKKYIGK
ncbi:MAG: hypothetical protein D6714_19030 [Bacteroidetes bacterium]|nr:MAG: hypothetical protein D6714_19030 [Bacteroidota bacterium]